MKNQIAPFTIVVAAGLLSACGGGGGGSSPNPAAGGQSSGGGALLTGRFVDGPVANLRFATPSQTGKTNANGEFTYRAGETVSFFVGDILIGQAPGAATVSPFTLAGTTPPTSAKEINLAVRQANRNTLPFQTNRASPLQMTGNISAFLQTLDEDGNPANGQQIPDAVHGLANGKTINFAQSFEHFRSDGTLRGLLANGRAAGLWGGTRGVRNPITALSTLYTGLGISPEVQAQTTADYDVNGDGSVQTQIRYTYDNPQGRTKEEYFNSAGANTANFTYQYDANGNLTSLQKDTNADGPVDQVTTYTYDTDGLLLREILSTGGQTVSSTQYTYAANGNLTDKVEVGRDSGGNNFFRATTYQYDTNRNVVRQEVDVDQNGTADSITTYTYDEDGRVQAQAIDSNADGTEDSRNTFTYDANGNVTRQEGTGSQTYVITSAYDGDGNQTNQTLNGVVISEYTYDPSGNGNLLKWTRYKDNGANIDFVVNFQYTTVTNPGAAGWL